MSDKNNNDEIIRQILDDKSLLSLNNLKHINKDKGKLLQDLLIQHFHSTRNRISYNEYLCIVNKLEDKNKKNEIQFKRRNNCFDLSDEE